MAAWTPEYTCVGRVCDLEDGQMKRLYCDEAFLSFFWINRHVGISKGETKCTKLALACVQKPPLKQLALKVLIHV